MNQRDIRDIIKNLKIAMHSEDWELVEESIEVLEEFLDTPNDD